MDELTRYPEWIALAASVSFRVPGLALALSISVRRLERRFLARMGRTPEE